MIELVFVIVIIGILAAVALPRFTGISDDAHVSKLEAFVGTLNRTTAPSMWSGVQRAEPAASGSLKNATAAKFNVLTTSGADAQLESIPSELASGADIALSGCADNNTTAVVPVPAIGSTGGAAIGGDIAVSATIGTTTYTVGCVDSNLATSAKFYLYDTTTDVIITK